MEPQTRDNKCIFQAKVPNYYQFNIPLTEHRWSLFILIYPPPTQQLIPYVEDDGSSRHNERSASQARPATEERREILEVNKVSCPLGLSRYKCTVRWALESTALYIKSNPNSDSRRREAKKCMTKYSVKTSYILYTILPVLLKY